MYEDYVSINVRLYQYSPIFVELSQILQDQKTKPGLLILFFFSPGESEPEYLINLRGNYVVIVAKYVQQQTSPSYQLYVVNFSVEDVQILRLYNYYNVYMQGKNKAVEPGWMPVDAW